MGDRHAEGPAAQRRLTRRSVLAGGALGAAGLAAGAVAVDQGVLPGRSRVLSLLGWDGSPGRIPDIEPGPVVSGSFVSTHRLGERCGWTIAYPPGDAAALPVAVVLHGRGADHTAAFGDYLGLDRFLASAVADGVEPFAIASVDGGDTYWHRRATGEDAGAMVIDEFLPLLAERGLITSRLALLGWSMGGYGALLLASELGPKVVAAVAAVSPALWQQADDATSGAFDGEADFAEHSMFARPDALADVPLRVDCGTADPFHAATAEFVASMSSRPEGGFQSGGHNVDYWRRMAPHQLAFVGEHLTG